MRKNARVSKINKLVADNIFYFRQEKNLLRKELAQYIDVSPQQLTKYEKGIDNVSVGRLMMIANALSKDVSCFFIKIDGINNHKA